VQQHERDDEAARRAAEEVGALSAQADDLKAQLRDHGPAAVAINALIRSYLRHGDIEIVPVDDGFELRRANGRAARNLSEGEKTAVTFCYFLSSLEAEGRRLRDLIVVIDDPISSLDTKALNYAFSLIRGHLGACRQLIILTHNINFLNSCRQWLKPRSIEGKAALLFLDLRMAADGVRRSTITKLPTLIRDYDSEYHYLFSLVRQFANSDGADDDRLFLMPNAMRKVAEIFLAFKRPGADGLASKVQAIAEGDYGVDPNHIRALDRLVQLESHADSLDDLVSFSSMTIEESYDCARSLMQLIETLDANHFAMQGRQCDRAA
jgi:wobble nucleotide-excising tRNase